VSLIAVRRLYPDAVPPTAWTLDGTPLATKRFKFTRRTDQASSASFECSGSPALTKEDRVFAYGLTDIAGTLGAAIADDSVTTMTLAAAGEFPAENYLVLIGTELIWCGTRAGVAVSACVRGIGGTTAAAHANGTPIYIYWTWGGIVKSVQRTKKGYSYGCLDFVDYISDAVVTKDYPSGAVNTDVEILEDMITYLHTPLNVQIDHVGITPLAMYAMALENKTVRSVLDEFCLLTGNHYYAYQGWYDLNPQIRYFDPSGAASGITLAVGDIYADWSTDTDRTTIVNSLDAVATFPDIEPDPLVGLLWGTLDYDGVGTYDAILGKVADLRCGFQFTSPVDCIINQLTVYMKRVGAYVGNVYVYLHDASGNDTSYLFAVGATLPGAQSDTYVKATTKYSTNYWPYFATNPLLSLIGGSSDVSWVCANGTITNQRFHIDLGSAKVVDRVYYENFHETGTSTNAGVRHFTIWGSNTVGAFADLDYAHDTDWVQITAAVAEFDIHVSANTPDPKYFLITNSTAYRYYAFKFADNWGHGSYMGLRHVELKTANTLSTFIYKQLMTLSM